MAAGDYVMRAVNFAKDQIVIERGCARGRDVRIVIDRERLRLCTA